MIPKVIYMCHKHLDKIKIYSKNWKNLNPEYEIKLYDDKLCKKFLLQEYSPLHLKIFNYLKDGPIKADFWRVCILNKYGGLYVDADIEPIIPLKKYISNNDYFVTCISSSFNKNNKTFQLNPHFILSDKNNKILKSCINRYILKYIHKHPYSYWDWSICNLLLIKGILHKKSYITYIDNKRFKFLYEKDYSYCLCGDLIVFKNRYDNYKNHNFIE